MVGRPINQNKMVAEVAGEATYRGSEHGCGTNERYTKTGSCVFCARRKQREGREARIAMAQRDAEARDQSEAFLDLASADAADQRVIAETFPGTEIDEWFTEERAEMTEEEAEAYLAVEEREAAMLQEPEPLDSDSEVKYPEPWD